MTKAELFRLFCKYDQKRVDALELDDAFDRADEVDRVLCALLSELAIAAREERDK